MVGQTPPADTSNGSTVRTLELVFIGVAVFGAAFAVARAAFEKKLPYAPPGALPNPVRRGWSYRPPVKGYTAPSAAPRLGGWPTYAIRLQQQRGGYGNVDLLEMEWVPGDVRPTEKSVGTYRNKNEALYQAGLLLQAYARKNPRNTNVLRVLDEKGRCAYAILASEYEPGYDELEC